jgi:plastocyanin
MRRRIVIVALLASAAIHAVLAPEHLAEMPNVGIAFVTAAAVAVTLAAWLVHDQGSSRGLAASSVLFVVMIGAWAVAVTIGIPLLMNGSEPVELAAVICKLIEAMGLLAAASLAWRRVLALAVPGAVLVVAVSGAIAAAGNVARDVDIPGKLFEPERLEVLVGDTVTWTNDDAVTHTVTADKKSFDSGDLTPHGAFSVTFDRPGRITYHCAIHRFMTGEIDVFAVALSGPLDPVAIGREFSLRGLAAPGTDLVTIERRDANSTFVREADAFPSADGRFAVTVPAGISTDYRAVAGTLTSPLVHVDVSPRVALHVERIGRRERLIGSAAPPQPGMPALVQVYSRERFDWVRLARVRFDAGSRIRFTLSPRKELYLRLFLLHATPGLVGGMSNVVSVRPARRPQRVQESFGRLSWIR